MLFFANYRRYLYLFKRILLSANTKATLIIVEELKEIYKEIQKRIE
jgi:hypothetical protein